MESKRIAGRYQIEGLLGRGGMARVYLAVDTMLGRQVAVKVLNSDGVSDPTFVERFRREARSAAQLNHPNIVAVYDWGEEDREFGSTYYMVMEYIDGPTLKQVIADRAPLSEVEALDVAEQVATALDVAHGHGIIHRDVKPHNILLAPDGWVKMTDFGIAQATGVSRLTLENVVTGSPHYLSPEQARGDRVDARSDLYSLGIVLYEMLTGWEPFGGASVQEVLTQHVHEPPPSLREHNAKISAVTESVVGIALAKAPSDRFADAAAMRDALRQARRAPRDETVAAAPIPPPPPAPASNRTAPPPARPARARRREPSGGIHRKAVLPALLAVLVVLGAAAFGAMEALGSFGARPISNVAGKGPRSNPVPSRSHPKDSATVRPVATARPTAKAFARATAVATNPPATAAPLVASTGSGDPSSAVVNFYRLVATHQFTQAASLWSDSMRASFSPGVYIDKRFAQTRSIFVQTWRVTSLNRNAGTATVAVNLVEQRDPPLGTERWSGTWNLVLGSGGWLLDRPQLYAASSPPGASNVAAFRPAGTHQEHGAGNGKAHGHENGHGRENGRGTPGDSGNS